MYASHILPLRHIAHEFDCPFTLAEMYLAGWLQKAYLYLGPVFLYNNGESITSSPRNLFCCIQPYQTLSPRRILPSFRIGREIAIVGHSREYPLHKCRSIHRGIVNYQFWWLGSGLVCLIWYKDTNFGGTTNRLVFQCRTKMLQYKMLLA